MLSLGAGRYDVAIDRNPNNIVAIWKEGESGLYIYLLYLLILFELGSVIGSDLFSLRDYITPDLEQQLRTLRDHMGIKSFASPN